MNRNAKALVGLMLGAIAGRAMADAMPGMDGMAGMQMPAQTPGPDAASPTAQAAAVVHQGQGEVTGIEEGGKVLVIAHKDIPGYMSAMTMPFELADPALAAGLAVGDRIEFTLTQKGDFWPITALHKITSKRKRKKASAEAVTSTAGSAATASGQPTPEGRRWRKEGRGREAGA